MCTSSVITSQTSLVFFSNLLHCCLWLSLDVTSALVDTCVETVIVFALPCGATNAHCKQISHTATLKTIKCQELIKLFHNTRRDDLRCYPQLLYSAIVLLSVSNTLILLSPSGDEFESMLVLQWIITESKHSLYMSGVYGATRITT